MSNYFNRLFGDLHAKVQMLPLNDLVKQNEKSKIGAKTAAQMECGEIPFFTSGKSIYYIDEYMVDGENIFVNDGGTADIKYYDGKASYADHVFSLSPNKIEAKYLYYYLLSKRDYINDKLFKGTGIKNINKKEFMKMRIPVPDENIQKRIIEVMDTLTKLSEGLQKELELRKKQYEYYMTTMLVSNSSANEYTLEQVCQIVDCPHSSPVWREEGIPVIRNYNLVNGRIVQKNMSYVSEDDYVERTKRVVPEMNDIMFSREAPIGNVGIVPEKFMCCQGQRVVLLRPNKAVIDARFLVYLLQGSLVRKQIEIVTHKGGTVSNFNISDLKKLSLIVPSLEEQERIVKVLEKFDLLCNDEELGLPAEITARTKQYEYYRDQLFGEMEDYNER